MDDLLFSIHCPECGEEVEPDAPQDHLLPGPAPDCRHVSDKTTLCLVIRAHGHVPAFPVEHALQA